MDPSTQTVSTNDLGNWCGPLDFSDLLGDSFKSLKRAFRKVFKRRNNKYKRKKGEDEEPCLDVEPTNGLSETPESDTFACDVGSSTPSNGSPSVESSSCSPVLVPSPTALPESSRTFLERLQKQPVPATPRATSTMPKPEPPAPVYRSLAMAPTTVVVPIVVFSLLLLFPVRNTPVAPPSPSHDHYETQAPVNVQRPPPEPATIAIIICSNTAEMPAVLQRYNPGTTTMVWKTPNSERCRQECPFGSLDTTASMASLVPQDHPWFTCSVPSRPVLFATCDPTKSLMVYRSDSDQCLNEVEALELLHRMSPVQNSASLLASVLPLAALIQVLGMAVLLLGLVLFTLIVVPANLLLLLPQP